MELSTLWYISMILTDYSTVVRSSFPNGKSSIRKNESQQQTLRFYKYFYVTFFFDEPSYFTVNMPIEKSWINDPMISSNFLSKSLLLVVSRHSNIFILNFWWSETGSNNCTRNWMRARMPPNNSPQLSMLKLQYKKPFREQSYKRRIPSTFTVYVVNEFNALFSLKYWL